MTSQYIKPDTLGQALELLDRHRDEAKVIAGGTAVVLLLQQKLIQPRYLIDLGGLADLSQMERRADGLHIGPLVRLTEIERSAAIGSAYPALAQCVGSVGNVRIRNQATLGGSLAEADYASDPPAFLLGLEAEIELTCTEGVRRVVLAEFMRGLFTTDLRPNELITDIILPPLPGDCRMAYLKFKTRSSEDRPCVGVAALAVMDAGRVSELRLVVGAACETPRRLPQAEALARGLPLSDELISEIADAYAAGIETLDDLRGSAWYRTQMVRVQVRRALEALRHGRR